ncbi:MAG: hypothetical protein ACYDCK_14980 [Thermoplasmatota archaeon]
MRLVKVLALACIITALAPLTLASDPTSAIPATLPVSPPTGVPPLSPPPLTDPASLLGPDFIGVGAAATSFAGAPGEAAGYGTIRNGVHGPTWTFNADGVLYSCSGGHGVAYADPEELEPIGTAFTCGGSFGAPTAGLLSFAFSWSGVVVGFGAGVHGSLTAIPSP